MIGELPDQLIAQAEFLIGKSDKDEASVRRAVSTAYYALFHLLVRDAILNWKHFDHRSRLARTFDHKRMREASSAILRDLGSAQNFSISDPEREIRFRLRKVAEAFIDLQQARHKADYDISESLQPIDAAVDVARVRRAFSDWSEIRDTGPAQAYLFSLLFRERS